MLISIIKVLYNLKTKKLSHLDIKPLNILVIYKSKSRYRIGRSCDSMILVMNFIFEKALL